VVGAITLGVINNMLNMVGISPYLQGTVKGLVIIGAVFIQRQRSRSTPMEATMKKLVSAVFIVVLAAFGGM